MDIEFANKKLEKVCSNTNKAIQIFGKRRAELIFRRIAELRAAPSVEFVLEMRLGRCHRLLNNRWGQFAMDLDHLYRLVFEVIERNGQTVCIIEITDYH